LRRREVWHPEQAYVRDVLNRKREAITLEVVERHASTGWGVRKAATFREAAVDLNNELKGAHRAG
jgi:hypothetical protein